MAAGLRRARDSVRRRRAERRRREAARRLYRSLLAPGATAFDVGANVGARTSALLAESINVVAFEPQAACCRALEARFGRNPAFALERRAVASAEGKSRLYLSSVDTIASTNPEWIAAVRESGRLAGFEWSGEAVVPTTTLDQAVETYGTPAFCKIDVEGGEYEVLMGLSTPIPLLAIEHVPEYASATAASVDLLRRLAPYGWNYSPEESSRLVSATWWDADELMLYVDRLPKEGFGDVYACAAPAELPIR